MLWEVARSAHIVLQRCDAPNLRERILAMANRHLKLVYVLVSVLWVAYSSFKLTAAHIADHTPFSIGTLLCLLLFVSIPACGYALLFKLFPWAGRSLRR